MQGYVIAFLFIAFTHMSNSRLVHKLRDKSQMWTILNYTETTFTFIGKILNRYSIWIFHCTVYTLLFATEVNYMSMTLCFVELIVFPLQLYQWLKSKEEVYVSIYKSWKYLFNLIIANCVYKYFTFFGRYITIKRVYKGFFDLWLPEKFMVFVMDWKNTRTDSLHNDFFYDTVLLIFAFYTNKCILENVSREMATDVIYGLDEKLVELGMQSEKKLSIEYRRTTSFTTLLLILKGFTFLFIGFHTMNNINAFKVVLMLVPLIYFNVLFIRITKSIRVFEIRDMIHLCKLSLT
jgi:hypothetical protein